MGEFLSIMMTLTFINLPTYHRRYELIEARVRMYAIRHDRPFSSSSSSHSSPPLYFQSYPLTLDQPKDGVVLMQLPATVTYVRHGPPCIFLFVSVCYLISPCRMYGCACISIYVCM